MRRVASVKTKKIILKKKKTPDIELEWYFVHEGVRFGPMQDDALCNAADTGLLSPEDEVWRTDMDDCVPATDVAGLFDNDIATDEPAGLVEHRPEPEDTGSIPLFELHESGSGSMTCPYCWFKFDPEDMLFVARHPDLMGDNILSSDEAQRFLPSRFTPDGHAIDSEGVVCPDMACPRCHMRLPRSICTMPPLFLSLVGAPASGKSYFLASMCWKQRKTLPATFAVRFTDSDGALNQWLTDYEDRLFVQGDSSEIQAIEKTEERGHMYREATISGMSVSLPLPSVFTLQSFESSRFHSETNKPLARSLVLYDNAGEHFQPGRDSARDPGTQHLLHSEAIFFMFDPTKSPEFRRALQGGTDPQLKLRRIVQRQDTLLLETINRIRLYSGMDAAERHKKPVLVLISKADLLNNGIEEYLEKNPWRWNEEWQTHCLDVEVLHQASFELRCLLSELVPEVVHAVESFADDVLYLPVTALGTSPLVDPSYDGPLDAAPLVVRPSDIQPKWVEVPLLYVLYRLGYIGGVARVNEGHDEPESIDEVGGQLRFRVPGTEHTIMVPTNYAGYSLRDPETKTWFHLPEES